MARATLTLVDPAALLAPTFAPSTGGRRSIPLRRRPATHHAAQGGRHVARRRALRGRLLAAKTAGSGKREPLSDQRRLADHPLARDRTFPSCDLVRSDRFSVGRHRRFGQGSKAATTPSASGHREANRFRGRGHFAFLSGPIAAPIERPPPTRDLSTERIDRRSCRRRIHRRKHRADGRRWATLPAPYVDRDPASGDHATFRSGTRRRSCHSLHAVDGTRSPASAARHDREQSVHLGTEYGPTHRDYLGQFVGEGGSQRTSTPSPATARCASSTCTTRAWGEPGVRDQLRSARSRRRRRRRRRRPASRDPDGEDAPSLLDRQHRRPPLSGHLPIDVAAVDVTHSPQLGR